ncbi:WD40 repeat-like protein [Coprinellus micaceus]|uniref:WD40 repeat-like protein n=1 Tax=Coprinellus micaceus TaxID=71717 RepID=A0A4Y7SN73_COPMI|nr:WD40 repeat-like protein [Coprinellus micaceus]
MMDAQNAPPELKKEGSDWWALYNPRKVVSAGGVVRKPVDVSLVHNIMHESVVCCVKFSADGKFLATGSNRSAQIYNTQSGLKVCTLVDEDAVTGKQGDLYIRSVCFSPCGRWLATGAEDKVVRIWDIAKEKIRSVFDGHQQEIYALEFSLDGRLLVSGSGDKTARVWDVTSVLGRPHQDNGSSSSSVVGDQTQPTVLTIDDSLADKMPELDVDGDEDVDMGGEGKKESREGDLGEGMDVEGAGRQGEAGAPEPSADPGITSIAVSPDGRYVAAGSLDSVIRLWDLRPRSTSKPPSSSVPPSSSSPAPPKLIERLKGHGDSVYSVSFTRDGRFLGVCKFG